MSVIFYSVTDQGEVRSGANGGSITLRGLAKTNNLDDSLSVLRRDLSQYQRWQRHKNEPGFFVDEFSATQRPHSVWWEFTANYTDQATQDPLSIPARCTGVKTITLPGATILDYQKKLILNTAGEPPEPFDKPERVMCYTFEKNVVGLPDWLLDFEDCINDDAVQLGSKTASPKTLLISSITLSDENTQGDTKYRTATIEVLKRKSTWEVIFPSRGFNQVESFRVSRTGTGSTVKRLVPIRLNNGELPTEPQFLDRDGKWMPHPDPADVVILKAQLYQSIPYNRFPLR